MNKTPASMHVHFMDLSAESDLVLPMMRWQVFTMVCLAGASSLVALEFLGSSK